jgi:hypothetical protein
VKIIDALPDGRPQVEPDRRVEVRLGELRVLVGDRAADVDVQHVEPPEPIVDAIEEGPERIDVGGVGGHRVGAAPCVRGEGRGLLHARPVDVDGEDLGALGAEPQRGGAAHPGAGAGDERDPSLQQHRPPSGPCVRS